MFGVHGIGGIVGAILTGVFAAPSLGGFGTVGTAEGVSIGAQVLIQIKGVLLTVVWTGIGSFILLKLVGLIFGLRVSADAEEEGLDITQHGERGYIL